MKEISAKQVERNEQLRARAAIRMTGNAALQAKAVAGGFALSDMQVQLGQALAQLPRDPEGRGMKFGSDYWLADIKFPEHEDGEKWTAVAGGPDGKLYAVTFELNGNTIKLVGEPAEVVGKKGFEYVEDLDDDDDGDSDGDVDARAGTGDKVKASGAAATESISAANEAGVNQHTKGTADETSQRAGVVSKRADAASAEADGAGSHAQAAALHAEAEQAHLGASKEQMRAGDPDKQAAHVMEAQRHHQLADSHLKVDRKATEARDAKSKASAAGRESARVLECRVSTGQDMRSVVPCLEDGIVMYMPGGQHTITPSQDGRAVTVCVNINAQTAANLERQRAALTAKGKVPFFSITHDSEEAGFWPKRFFWATRADATGAEKSGVWVQGDWTDAGTAAVQGKNFRTFSPTFFVDEVKADPSDPAEVVCNEDARANMGALENDPAFQKMSPLWCRNRSAIMANKPIKAASETANEWACDGCADSAMADKHWKAAADHTAEASHVAQSPLLAEDERDGLSKAHLASAAAHKASEEAYRSGKPDDHQRASEMHAAASDLQEKFDQSDTVREKHDFLVKDHQEKAALAEQNDDDQPGIDARAAQAAVEAGDYPGHAFHGNQFTGGEGGGAHNEASKGAHDATVKAAKSGKSGDHKKAGAAHRKAARLHDEEGNDAAAAYHRSMAAYHAKKAVTIGGDKAGPGDKVKASGAAAAESISASCEAGNAGANTGRTQDTHTGENMAKETVAELQARKSELEQKVVQLSIKNDDLSKLQVAGLVAERGEVEARLELAKAREEIDGMKTRENTRAKELAANAVGLMVRNGKVGARDTTLQQFWIAKFTADPSLIEATAGRDEGLTSRHTASASQIALNAAGEIDAYASCTDPITGGFNLKKALNTYAGLVARNQGVRVAARGGAAFRTETERVEAYRQKGRFALESALFFKRELAPRVNDWQGIPSGDLELLAGAVRQRGDGSLQAADPNQGTIDNNGHALDQTNTTGTLSGTLVIQRTLTEFAWNYPQFGLLFSDFSDTPGLYQQQETTRIVSQPATEKYDTTAGTDGRPNGWSVASPAKTADASIKLTDYIGVPIVFGQEVLSSTTRRLFDEQAKLGVKSIADYFTNMVTALCTASNFNAYATANGTTVKTAYPTYAKSQQEWANADLDFIGAAFDDNKVPDSDRGLLLNAQYYAKLRGDTRLLMTKAATGGSAIGDVGEFITSNKLPGDIGGFKTIKAPWFPSMANGVGFAFHKAGIMVKSRLPQDFTRALNVMIPGSVTTVTDPDTGISLLLVQYVSLTGNFAEWRLEVLLGASLGDSRGGLLVTSQ